MTKEHMIRLFETILGKIDANLAGDYKFGWNFKSIGAAVSIPDETVKIVWMKISVKGTPKYNSRLWNGEIEAANLVGVKRPNIIRYFDFEEDEHEFRCMIMDFISDSVFSCDGVYPESAEVPDTEWFESLKNALNNLSKIQTSRVGYSGELIHRRIKQVLGFEVNLHNIEWRTAHCDLHWANITKKNCFLLDWEGWGNAPVGIDEAFLLAHASLNKQLLKEVLIQFSTVFHSEVGRISVLFVCSELISMNRQYGYNNELVEPVTRLATAFASEKTKVYK